MRHTSIGVARKNIVYATMVNIRQFVLMYATIY